MNQLYSKTEYSSINYRMIAKVLGQMLMVESLFMLPPTLLCLSEEAGDWLPFAIVALITLLSGIALNTWSHPTNRVLKRRDGMLLASVTWIIFSAFGMLPFIFSSAHLNVSEAFFEAMSGFTTTGATVIRDVESCSQGLLLWRALTQWIGGLGIILFTLTFIPALNNSGSLMLFHAESTGITHDKLAARLSRTAKMLWGLYILFTIVLMLLLYCGPMSLYESVCHALACISTGGYSTQNEGIAAYDSAYLKSVLTVFMFIGGVSFSLIISSVRTTWRALWHNDVFRAYVYVIGIFYVLMVIAIIGNGHYTGWESITIDPLFHIVSAMTSTGFSAGNWEGWGIFVLTLTFFMMYIGACAGSTSGGAKIDRVLYLNKNLTAVVRKYVRPRLLHSVNVNGQYVGQESGNEIIAFIFIYTLLIVVGGLVLVAQGFPIVDAFFSSFSCVSNNGLGAGITGVTGSFDFLPSSGKVIMSFLMLAGRLEIITLIALFVPSFWKNGR
ncbi:MAG: TrkH family potassium uptake protein [Bacteroidales bacterium]|nr:TrkH family potassium uptake protein [Bacteroidales bacterium]